MHPMNRGPPMQETVIVAWIMDCPMITVHAGKWYKAIIDSGIAISLLWYSTYQSIEDSFKPTYSPLLPNWTQPMVHLWEPLGMTALHLQIAEFKFTHNFVICDRLPDTGIIFGIDIQKSFHFHTPGTKKRIVTYNRMCKFLTYTWNCEQKATIGTVKSSLKIPTCPNAVVPIKITGPVIKETYSLLHHRWQFNKG